MCQADVDLAVTAARKAFSRRSPWRKLDASKRGQLMMKLASLMKDNITYLAVHTAQHQGPCSQK